MPQLGETVTEGTIVSWHKQVGDAIAVDDVLFEVSTEKVDTEVPSAHAGVLRVIHVAEGDTVPVGTLLAVITDTADEPLDDVVPPTSATDGDADGDGGADGGETRSAPAAEQSPQPVEPPATPAPARTAGPARGNGEQNGFLSPVVRALLSEHGLEPGDVVGTGAGSRITRNDVLAAAANTRRTTATAATPATSPAPPAHAPAHPVP